MWSGSTSDIYSTENKWNASTYKGLVTFPFTASANTGVKWTLYQPKWQKNDYYKYNFRVNKGDTIKAHYSDASNTISAAADPVTIYAGAASLAGSALALGSLMLAF